MVQMRKSTQYFELFGSLNPGTFSPNIARKCNIRASECKKALANSEAQRRNLEPTVCVGTMGPIQTVGDEERGHAWPFSDHFSRRAQRAS